MLIRRTVSLLLLGFWLGCAADATAQLTGNITQESGVLAYPGSNQTYLNNEDRYWVINTPVYNGTLR